jgi:hypothetical protein
VDVCRVRHCAAIRALDNKRDEFNTALVNERLVFKALVVLCDAPPLYDVFATLPDELLFMIAAYLPYTARVAFASCSRHTRVTRVTNAERKAFIMECPLGLRALAPPGPVHWFDFETKNGKERLEAIAKLVPRKGSFSNVIAYHGLEVVAYTDYTKTKLVWKGKSVLVNSTVKSVILHPAFPLVIALCAGKHDAYKFLVWDGTTCAWSWTDKPLAPLAVIGQAVHFYTAKMRYIL